MKRELLLIAFICVATFGYTQERLWIDCIDPVAKSISGMNEVNERTMKMYIADPQSNKYTQLTPFDYYPYSIVQTLSYENEIGTKGLVSALPDAQGKNTLEKCSAYPVKNNEIETAPETIIREYPFKEGFESGQIPASWTIMSEQNNQDWEIVDEVIDEGRIFTPHSGQYFACLLDEEHYSTTTLLITPMLDLHALSNPQLSFWHVQAQTDYSEMDSLAVFYKNSSEGPWKYLAGYSGKIESWKKETIQLPEASSTYWIAFKGITRWGRGLMLDDIEIYDKTNDKINDKKGNATISAKPSLQDKTESSVNTFPNPVQTRLTISGENIEKVEIYNILGGKIGLVPFEGKKQQQIDMQQYEAGIYLLKIYLPDGKFATKRIVVK
jgi:hypothetical protein